MARSIHDLAALISPSLGEQKARTLVTDAARLLGLGGEMLEHTQCLKVLDAIASQSGIVGISARFAKSRIHLVKD
jgi:hypothetical protein